MDKIKVIITNKQKDVKIPTGLRMLIRRCCNAVLKMEKFEGSVEVSVTLVNNKQIRELNSIYRNIDRVTDVLSFPMGENGKYDTLNRLTVSVTLSSVKLAILPLILCFIFSATTMKITAFSVSVCVKKKKK